MKLRRGFTIIEVSLVVAISSLLIVGLIVGTGTVINRHRYDDSVQQFAEFLRQEYSRVINIENNREGFAEGITGGCQSGFNQNNDPNSDGDRGRTDCLIYGRLITFGQEDENGNPETTIRSYSVIGNIPEPGALAAAPTVRAAFQPPVITLTPFAYVAEELGNVGTCNTVAPMIFSVPWDAHVTTKLNGVERDPARLAILIVRSPSTGTIHTFVNRNPTAPNNPPDIDIANCAPREILYTLNAAGNYTLEDFQNDEPIVFCVSPSSSNIFALGAERRSIRIAADGRNSSAVTIVDEIEGDC